MQITGKAGMYLKALTRNMPRTIESCLAARDSTLTVITNIVTTGYMGTLTTLARAHAGRQDATLRDAAQRKRKIAPLTVEAAKECAGSSMGGAPDPESTGPLPRRGKRDVCG